MVVVIMKQWMSGGTGITNFRSDKFPIYREAVRRYGDPNLVIVDEAFPPGPGSYGGSLHDLRFRASPVYSLYNYPSFFDLSAFWELFYQIENSGNTKTEDPSHAYDRAMKGIAP